MTHFHDFSLQEKTAHTRESVSRTGLLAALALAASGLAAAADPGPIRQISAGYDHACAVTEAGEAWCWGGNWYGQLGRGNSGGQSNSPVRVSTSTPGFDADNIAWIDAGVWSTCALTTAGQVFCWGSNQYGTLGTGWRTPGRNVPTPVNIDHPLFGDDNIVSLGRNGRRWYTPCALTDSGQAFCWGWNREGQVGNGTRFQRRWRPKPVNTDAVGFTRRNIAQISAASVHACALNLAGRAFCWGDNEFGQLGNGTTEASNVPVRIDHTAPGLRGAQIAAIGAGGAFTCALTEAGRVACWGHNDRGQLGNGSTEPSAVALPVSTERLPFRRGRIAQIDAGGWHACALTDTGRAFCWGGNIYGATGDGRPAGDRLTPVPVDTSTPGFGINNIAAISAGQAHSCALTTRGAVFCWGANHRGQSAAPSGTNEVWTPRRVRFPSD